MRLLRQVWSLFDAPARRRIVALNLLLVLGAMLEAGGAALIVPFIAMIGDPTYVTEQPQLRQIHELSGLGTVARFQAAVALALLGFFVAKNLYLAYVNAAQFRFVYTEMARISERMLRNYLRRPYEFHIRTNSAELTRNLSNDVLMFATNVLVPALTLVSEALVIVAMTAILLWLAPGPALLAVALLAAMGGLFHYAVRARVRRYGAIYQQHNADRLRWIAQSLGGVKEIQVLGRDEHFVAAFARHERAFADAYRYAMVLSQSPRIFLEAIAFSALFLGVAGVLLADGSTTQLLPVLALFAIAAVRMLPSINRIAGAVTRIAYYRGSIEVVCADAGVDADGSRAQPLAAPLPFADAVVLEGVSYRYPGAASDAIGGVDLRIARGTSIALVGPSGAGKTTLADLLLGLLQPTTGRMLVDGADVRGREAGWQRTVGYIPQQIFLIDDSIRRNVAFGLPDMEIDDAKVWAALDVAQLGDFVRAQARGLDAPVGERGVMLSGGQRQRVGIARALYGDPAFLVLDEATSALDEATEREFASAIETLVGRMTLVVVAHREATIRLCRERVELQAGRIRR